MRFNRAHSKKGCIFLSPERALYTSPGQRPGKISKIVLSPVRRHINGLPIIIVILCVALSGLKSS